MTTHLTMHRQHILAYILPLIPYSQKQISTKKRHKVLGELQSMPIALTRSRNLFGQMQLSLSKNYGSRIALHKGVHCALDDLHWIHNDISSRPTHISELVPLISSAKGHPDMSVLGAVGSWLPSLNLVPREGFDTKPLLWRFKLPLDIISRLVTKVNPHGTITKSYL